MRCAIERVDVADAPTLPRDRRRSRACACSRTGCAAAGPRRPATVDQTTTSRESAARRAVKRRLREAYSDPQASARGLARQGKSGRRPGRARLAAVAARPRLLRELVCGQNALAASARREWRTTRVRGSAWSALCASAGLRQVRQSCLKLGRACPLSRDAIFTSQRRQAALRQGVALSGE